MVCARSLQTSNPGSLELSKLMVLHQETIGVMSASRESKETQNFWRTWHKGFSSSSFSASSPLDSKHGGEPRAHTADEYTKPKAGETLPGVVTPYLIFTA